MDRAPARATTTVFVSTLSVSFMRWSTCVVRLLPLFGLPCDGFHKIKVDAISTGCITQSPDNFSVLSLTFSETFGRLP